MAAKKKQKRVSTSYCDTDGHRMAVKKKTRTGNKIVFIMKYAPKKRAKTRR